MTTKATGLGQTLAPAWAQAPAAINNSSAYSKSANQINRHVK